MGNTVNFTGSVDRDLLKRAKVITAKSDTSVNALSNAELRLQQVASLGTGALTANLGEIAIQEVMNSYALTGSRTTAIFLFEDHRIANASFLVPENCQKVSTRAFLTFLEQTGALPSALAVERRTI